MAALVADRILVDGSWRTPQGEDLPILSPSSEEVALRFTDASPADIDAAVAAARRAFDSSPWRRMTVPERAALLAPVFDELHKRWGTDIATPFTEVAGTPVTVARAFEAGARGIFTDLARTAAEFVAEEPVLGVGGRAGTGHPARLVREPVGVVAAIAPWNGQLYLTLTKLLPALAAGCTGRRARCSRGYSSHGHARTRSSRHSAPRSRRFRSVTRTNPAR
jgi:aldehyde dehydrogenase (NAD+)